LIVAPLRPMYKVWPDEISKWEDFKDLTYAILHGDVKEHNLGSTADIYLINPEGLLWLAGKEKLPEFDCIIIDESTKFKDSTTKRFRILKKILPTIARRWILTGTPVPNGISDLFGQIYILDQGGALGRYITHFRMQYFERSGYNLYEWKPRVGAFDEIVAKISPLILQLSANDYLEMPERPAIPPTLVELPPDAMGRYRSVEDDFLSIADSGNIIASNAAVAGIKCRQLANGAVYDENRNVIQVHEAKLDALEGLLEELSGAPTLVMYEFQHDADRIMARLGKLPIFSSGLSGAKLDALIDNFNKGSLPILLGHPASMGHGLNLQQACNHIIWFGIPWNLEHYDQAIARIYRQGQTAKSVFVYHIVAKDTLDERVLKVLRGKDRTQQAVLGALGISGARHTLMEPGGPVLRPRPDSEGQSPDRTGNPQDS
jgi:SNF2 family DNA or RNA helicase